ncbi:tRNA 2-thiouridine(34) synthase MnmA [Planctellipticum variicoloris]|uniref:tRNA 2-thiouridine(34) synthase MnmA n=1 Tax=Planctellipticum variicoloris TaxID=3064265 RepID=UPI002CDCF542|nr:tRNA 2-thiouridine(34) synthase MnmA [Planctomycetaceae bacterium SH412]HTN04225.1 tRNA 2-thiouridine(34) synthase MnmA [Planctomycetaceae bacterium]
MSRIVLAMSGGVDSSAAAVLLKEQGCDVIGLFMRSGATDDYACHTGIGPALPIVTAKANKQGCCSASDAADARRVADLLDIPFHSLNFENAFGRIKDYFADEYLAGRTPNPCVMCNNWLKFGKLWDFARQVGADAIATGHYARLRDIGEDQPALVRGLDPGKDQSYVLAGISRDLLGRIQFPVGNYTKPEIRELAARAGLRVATKPDSQEICFVPDNDYAGFLRRHRGEFETAGEFVDPAGRVLGRHAGYEHFTIGQRRGLGITFGEPRFVIRIDAESKRVVLGTKEDLACESLVADRVNWLAPDLPEPMRCLAQIRYQHTAAPCTVTREDAERVRVTFDERQSGVAPGQAVVFYAHDRVLGGGWIAASGDAGRSLAVTPREEAFAEKTESP